MELDAFFAAMVGVNYFTLFIHILEKIIIFTKKLNNMKTRTLIIAFCIFSVIFSTCMTIWNKADGASSSPTFVTKGDGFIVYRITDGGQYIYIAKSTNSYPVSIGK